MSLSFVGLLSPLVSILLKKSKVTLSTPGCGCNSIIRRLGDSKIDPALAGGTVSRPTSKPLGTSSGSRSLIVKSTLRIRCSPLDAYSIRNSKLPASVNRF